MKQTSIDALNNHLFEAIEMLKNNNDPKASENEKIDIETAKTIANLGKVAVEGFKVKAQVLGLLSNPKHDTDQIKQLSIQTGITNPVDDL